MSSDGMDGLDFRCILVPVRQHDEAGVARCSVMSAVDPDRLLLRTHAKRKQISCDEISLSAPRKSLGKCLRIDKTRQRKIRRVSSDTARASSMTGADKIKYYYN